MEKQYIDVNARDTVPWTAIRDENENTIGLPLLALVLDILPILILIIFSSALKHGLSFLFIVLPPIAGATTGVVSLCLEKGGLVGKRLAIIAIALPLSLVAIIVVFSIVFFSVSTAGVISHM